ncbi:MAG: hypothetical protein Q9219_001174 [cf. Caloplaca sp. 3 TL-2023]
MPRPKRTKVAPSQPITFATIAAEKRKQDSEPLSTSGSVSSSREANGSDDSEGIITKNKAIVNRRGVAPQVVTMSGALSVEDLGETRLKPLSSRRRVALSRIAREADHAKAIESSRARRDAVLAAEKLGKEGKQLEIQVQVPSTQNLEVPITMPATSATYRNASMDKIQTSQGNHLSKPRTTPSRETSILAVENFKRRPRELSLLQIAQAQHAAEESELDDTLDDFNPDDESTPLHQTSTGLQHERSSTSSSHKSSSRKRKLSTPDVRVPESQPQPLPTRFSSPASSPSENLFDILSDKSRSSPALPTISASKSQLATPAAHSDTLAPPKSSSPPAPRDRSRQTKPSNRGTQPAIKPKAQPTKSKARKALSTILPPRSPSPAKSSPTNASTTRSPLQPLKTSALQNLLPRRRRVMSRNKENNIFELNTSSDMDTFNSAELEEDEDELSYHATAKSSRKPPVEKPKQVKKGKGGATAKGAKLKSKQSEGRASMTYTRKQHNVPDENDDAISSSGEDYDTGTVRMDGKVQEEMKKMAAKFREVDDWGLDFEEVTGSSDRMRDAR